MKMRDLIVERLGRHGRQDYIDSLVAGGWDADDAKAYVGCVLQLETWQFVAELKIRQRLADLLRERCTDEDKIVTVGELISEQELKTIITEEWKAAREHARDLN
jgi:hypothetical protein